MSVKDALSPIFDFIKGSTTGLITAVSETDGLISLLGDRISTTGQLIKTFIKDAGDITGATNKIKSIQDLILGENDAETAAKIKKATRQLDTWLYGSFDAFGDRIPGAIEKGLDTVKDNPLLTGAAVGGLSLGLFFPETTIAALRLAGIGLGIAAVSVMAGAFKKGLPIVLLISALQIAPDAEDQEAQERIKKVGENLVLGIKSLFSDEVLKDVDGGSSIFENVGSALESFGSGIVKQIFGSEFESEVANALVGAITAGMIAGAFGFGPAKLAFAAIGNAIVGGIKGSKAFSTFRTSFVTELFGPPNSYKASVEKAGTGVAKAFRAGFSVLAVGELFDASADNFIGEPQTISDKFGRALSKGALQGIAAAASTGIGNNPIILFASAIAGALTQSVYLVFTDPEIKSAARELGAELFEGFKDRFFGRKLTVEESADIATTALLNNSTNTKLEENAADVLQNSQDENDRELGRLLRGKLLDNQLIKELDISLKRLNSAIEGDKGSVAEDSARFRYLLKFAEVIERTPLDQQGALLQQFNNELEKFNDIDIVGNKLLRQINTLGRDIFIELRNGVYSATTSSFKSRTNLNGLATGGFVRGEGGPTDDRIPTMLSNGEYVVNAATVSKYGVGFLDALNSGKSLQFRAPGGLMGTATDVGTQGLNRLEAFIQAQGMQDQTFAEFAGSFLQVNPSEAQAWMDLHAPYLSHLSNEKLGNPVAWSEFTEITGIKTLGDIDNYFRSTGMTAIGDGLFNSFDTTINALREVLAGYNVKIPYFPTDKSEVPEFLFDSLELISKGFQYYGNLASQSMESAVKASGNFLTKKEPVNWDSEFGKALANGLIEAPKGLLYGAALGTTTFGIDKLLVQPIKGLFGLGKGIWDIVSGVPSGKVNKAGGGFLNIAKVLGGGVSFALRSLLTKSLAGYALHTAKYSAYGGGLYFLKGALDHYIGRGLFNPNRLDELEPEKKESWYDRFTGMFSDTKNMSPTGSSKRKPIFTALRATPDVERIDASKAILDSLPFNDESIEQISGYKRSAFEKQLNAYKNKITDRFENEEGGFFYNTSVPNPWSSKVVIADSQGYTDSIGVPIPLMDMYTKRLEDTNSLYDFFTSYNVGLHETKHALDFLTSAMNNPGYWAENGSTYKPGVFKGQLYSHYTDTMAMVDNMGSVLSNETKANLFAKTMSIAPAAALNDTISKSHGSYILKLHKTLDDDLMDKAVSIFGVDNYKDFVEKAINSTKQLRKEAPTNALIGAIQSGEDAINSALLRHNSFISDYFDRKNGIKKYANGGYVTGEGGPRDDKIPALLSNKEFVVNADATSKFRPILEAINSGSFGRFQAGTSSKPLSKSDQAKVESLQEAIGINKNALKQVSIAIQNYSSELFKLESGTIEAYEAGQKLQGAYLEQRKLQSNIEAYESEINYIRSENAKVAKKAASAVKGLTDELKALIESGNETANTFKDDFQRGLLEAFKTGDFDAFGESILDSFTTGVLDQFTSGLTDTIFKDLIGQADEDGNVKTPKILDKIFGGSKELGQTGEVSKELGTTSSDLLSVIKDIPKLFSGIFKGFGENLGKVFGNISSIFSGGSLGLGGGSGGSGGLGTLLNMGLSFFGLPAFLNNGGIVPNTPYSKIGVDSVPAMLTPGEMVIPADRVKSMNQESNRNTQQFNINVQGDVSRQTRKEIVRMIPQITSGVNMTNKENNYKRS